MKFSAVFASTALLATSALAASIQQFADAHQDNAMSSDMILTSKIEELETRGDGGRGRKHKKLLRGGKITWYNGEQLLRPACPGQPTPDDSSMTAAISLIAPPARCGDKIKISKGDSSVIVTVVDYCTACTPNWIDVTKGVFRHFDSTSAGVIQDMEFTVLGQ
ncbi:hypothetical protein ACQY0O_001282 [Thecaphora frezii]